ncbi:MAG: PEP-CTERM sorting domain-containing protein [Phycisphaerales bacterium]|nr:PEP-CTERM sorting domain-containing protein [Phycisphaerales bacterium]
MKARILAMCVSSAVGLAASSALAAPSAWWAPYSTDANTIGLWHFDDVTGSTGSFADSSGNTNTGTLNSTAGSTQVPSSTLTLTVPAVSGAGTGPGTGLFGTALDYDENQDAAVLATGNDNNASFAWGSVPNSGGALDYGNAVTLEAWIKPTAGDLAVNRTTYIAGSTIGNSGFNFGWDTNGLLFVDTRTTGGVYKYAQQSSKTLVADTWAHVAAVLSNDGTTTTATVYINGASAATSSWADSALGPASSIFNIGANGSALKWVMFRSQIDEVRLSNVAREFGDAPVPEPTSIALFGVTGALALARRRRH